MHGFTHLHNERYKIGPLTTTASLFKIDTCIGERSRTARGLRLARRRAPRCCRHCTRISRRRNSSSWCLARSTTRSRSAADSAASTTAWSARRRSTGGWATLCANTFRRLICRHPSPSSCSLQHQRGCDRSQPPRCAATSSGSSVTRRSETSGWRRARGRRGTPCGSRRCGWSARRRAAGSRARAPR